MWVAAAVGWAFQAAAVAAAAAVGWDWTPGQPESAAPPRAGVAEAPGPALTVPMGPSKGLPQVPFDPF